jgi:hypothetical protein
MTNERWVKVSDVMKALDPANDRDQKLENMRVLIANAVDPTTPVSDARSKEMVEWLVNLPHLDPGGKVVHLSEPSAEEIVLHIQNCQKDDA